MLKSSALRAFTVRVVDECPTTNGTLSPAVFALLPRHRRDKIRAEPFSDAWRAIALRNVKDIGRLSAEDQDELFGHTQVFLAEKVFEGAGGLEITDEIRVTIAVQACILLLHRETEYYPDLTTIIVYPSAFKVSAKSVDAYGVVTEDKQVRLGESWLRGPVIIAWDSALRGGRDPRDGHNVVIHEFAHQLDQEDGAADGAPDLDASKTNYRTWGRVLGEGFVELKWDTEHQQKSVMDKYGATSPAEFFAVLTETFFERPKHLRAEHPELYEQMVKYYHQDPAVWGSWDSDSKNPSKNAEK